MCSIMDHPILVSIITPCFNSEKSIQKTLESMLNQSYKNFEYIIIDGNSQDATIDIINNYKDKFNGRMRYVSEPDRGLYDAMNKGICMATGELIGIVNSDDFYEPDAIENMVAAMTGVKYQILYGFLRVIKNGKEIRTVIYHHENIKEQMITHPTCFITKAVYQDYGLYDIQYKSAADYEFMLRIFHQGGVTFHPVYKVISNFNWGGISCTEIGLRETLKIKYKQKVITGLRYYIWLLQSYLRSIIK